MRKQIIYKGKNLLPIVLVLGTVFPMYGKSDSLRPDSKLIDKNNQNNHSPVIFIRKGTLLFNANQSIHTDKKSSLPIKTKKRKTDNTLFISEGTAVYNLQDIVVYQEKKSNIAKPAKFFTKNTKPHKKPTETSTSKSEKIISNCFLNNNKRNHFILVSDYRSCISLTQNDYHNLLINDIGISVHLLAFPERTQSEYHDDMVSYYLVTNFNIRPPPL
ncbi:hypothetical protein CHRYSEOSP005_02470 [Chryseobacterium sp. Alg-005]|uniref:hypothetical protein n=1 Tax=Chryseobacterium sp. Alg-005 TaxID=3159516 RepID=UPI003555A2A6